MVFVQEYTRYEDGNGEVVVRLVLSDDYDALFQEEPTGALWTNIFSASVVREDLDEQDDGGDVRYAIAELEVSCSFAACATDDDEKAFWFFAQAADASEFRFFAKMVNPVYESGAVKPECVAFRGRVRYEKDGEDLRWLSGEWLTRTDPTRQLNFRAYSFDVDLLNDLDLDDLYEYIATHTEGGLAAAFQGADLVSYYLRNWYDQPSIVSYTAFANLIGLNDALIVLIEAAQNMIRERTGATSYTLTPVESDTGLKFRRTLFKPELGTTTNGDNFTLHNLNVASATLETDLLPCILLKPSAVNPLVHASMFNPDRDTEDGDSIERPLSVRRYQTFAEVLYAVARCFGCYLFAEFVSGSETRLSFVARKDVLKQRVYLRGATKGRLRTSLLDDDDAPPFEGQGSLYTIDGTDRYRFTATTDTVTPELSEARKDQGDAENLVLFTVSNTYVDTPYNGRFGKAGLYPHNTRFWIGSGGSFSLYGDVIKESISTALYFQGISRNEAGIGALTCLPAGAVSVGDGMARKEYATMPEFLNSLNARDKVAYKSEYEITVPYIDSFALEVVDGVPGEMSWRFMQVGAEVVLSEGTVLYNKTSGEFETLVVEMSFSAIGVERNFADWATTIRLQSIGRFALGIAPPGGGVIEPEEVALPLPSAPARELRILEGVITCDTHRPEWKENNPFAVGECYFGTIAHGWDLLERRAFYLTLEPVNPDDLRSMCTPEIETPDENTIRIVTVRRDTDTLNPHFVQGGGTWQFRYTLRERPQGDRGTVVMMPDAQDVLNAEAA